MPCESQLSLLNIRESTLGTCHGACLLKSPTAQTSISGSDASLRHAPRGHLLRLAALPELTFHFTTDHFFKCESEREDRKGSCDAGSEVHETESEVHYLFRKTFTALDIYGGLLVQIMIQEEFEGWCLPNTYALRKLTSECHLFVSFLLLSMCINYITLEFAGLPSVHRGPEVNQEAKEAECFRPLQSPSRTRELGTS